MQAFIDRFRYKASKARQAQSRLKMLARMQPIVAVSEQATASFDFPSPEPLPPPLVVLDGVEVGYAPGKPVLRRVDLRLDIDDRIALLGANGNGKSTMIKLLAGRLQPLSGVMRRSPKLKIGYFAQHQQDELDLAATPLQLMERSNPRGHVEKHRAHLARFGLGVGKADTAVGKLSGGEKARLLFALMTREAPHVLLLDEPTNHLDVDAREALVQALNEYEGAVVLVSHDPHLIGITADRLWLVADGRCTAFEGDLEDYRRLLLEQRREKAREKDSDRPEGDSRPENGNRKEKRRQASEARAQTAHLRKAAQTAERRLRELEGRRKLIEAKLADPEVYGGPTNQLMRLQLELSEIKKKIAVAEEAALSAEELARGAADSRAKARGRFFLSSVPRSRGGGRNRSGFAETPVGCLPALALGARLLLPAAGVGLLKIAEGMAGRFIGRPAPAGGGHRLLIAAVEQLDAEAEGADPVALGAVGEKQHLSTVGILVLDREPDRLLGGEAVLRRPMRQEAAVVIGPEMGRQCFDPLLRAQHDHGAIAALEHALQHLRQRRFQPHALQVIEADLAHRSS
jgi:ABC-type multidrug transport system ATPase subunit